MPKLLEDKERERLTNAKQDKVIARYDGAQALSDTAETVSARAKVIADHATLAPGVLDPAVLLALIESLGEALESMGATVNRLQSQSNTLSKPFDPSALEARLAALEKKPA